MNYYNEWDSFAAEWLKQLIKDGLIPNGEVDSRSIADVEPSDLKGFTQCHFFAGIGGWSRALQIAGWGSDRPVWTGSPPCQSFSTAGKGKGKDDERHLWPVFFNLIRECQPPTVFGEQVAAAIRYGWLDDLQIDFEKEGYAAGAFVLPAGSIGAPHKRERLFFVADSNSSNRWSEQKPEQQARDQWRESNGDSGISSSVANSHNERHERSAGVGWEAQRGIEHTSNVSLADSDEFGQSGQREVQQPGNSTQDSERQVNRAINASRVYQPLGDTKHDGSYEAKVGRSTFPSEAEGGMLESKGSDSVFWASSEVIYCRDGKYRPIPTEPALFPLANGISNRVGLLRGSGNAIVPQAAAEIIKAYLSHD